jgi:hypothetical protein
VHRPPTPFQPRTLLLLGLFFDCFHCASDGELSITDLLRGLVCFWFIFYQAARC